MPQAVETSSIFCTDPEVAELLGISLGRLRNKLSADCPLPPRICPPGSRHRLWPRDAVHAWLSQFLVCSSEQARRPLVEGRRDRPAKKERPARRR